MAFFDTLLDQATHRLRIDPELQQEVRHELLTHLEDSAAEYQAAGATEQESAEQAVKAFGDADILSDQLFTANRRRIRLRQVAKWTMRAILPPAAAVIAVSLAWGAVLSVAMLLVLSPSLTVPPKALKKVSQIAQERLINRLSPTDRFVFQHLSGPPSLDKALALVERWPNDPLYQAYATTLAPSLINSYYLARHDLTIGVPQVDRPALKKVLAIMNQGEKVEPDNGYYNLMKAGVLFRASAHAKYDKHHGMPALSFKDNKGRQVHIDFNQGVTITDAPLFERALGELRKAAAKPYLDSHVVDLAKRRLNLLPPPGRLCDEFQRSIFAHQIEMPQVSLYRGIFDAIGIYAVDLAAQGQEKVGLALLAEGKIMALRMASRTETQFDLLIVNQLYDYLTLNQAGIYQYLNNTPLFQQTRKQVRNKKDFADRLAEASGGEIQKTLDKMRRITSDGHIYYTDPKLIGGAAAQWQRRAEYAVSDQAAVAVLVALLLIVGLLRHGGTWLLEKAKGDRPMFIFVGWRRLGFVVFWACLVPAALYGVYGWLIPGTRKYGLYAWLIHGTGVFGPHTAVSRILVEYAFFAAAMFMLLRRLGDRAVSRRAEELGISLARLKPMWGEWLWIAIFTATTIAYEILWRISFQRGDSHPVSFSVLKGSGYCLAGGLLTYALFWLIRPFRADPTEGGQTKAIAMLLDALSAMAIMGIIFLAIFMYIYGTYPLIAFVTPLFAWTAVGCLIAAVAVIGKRALAGGRHINQAKAPVIRPHGAVPIVLTMALVLGLGFGGLLRWQEHRSVVQLDPTGRRWLDQIHFDHYQVLAEWMRKQTSPSKP